MPARSSTRTTSNERPTTFRSWLRERAEALVERYEAKENGEFVLTHIPTGIARLDAIGLTEPGILTCITANAGDGKSAFALTHAIAAARAGFDVQCYFLEDPAPLTADRYFSGALDVNSFKLRRLTADMTAAQLRERLNAAVADATWADRIIADDEQCETSELFRRVDARWTDDTRLIMVDYVQAFDAEGEEKSVERVIARLAWGMGQLAKERDAAVILFSQVRREVVDRGRQRANDWVRRNPEKELTAEAVEGFRPGFGDAMWSSKLTQAAKAGVSIFRPNRWIRELGGNAKDDVIQFTSFKGNFSTSNEIVTCSWDGPRARIVDRGGR